MLQQLDFRVSGFLWFPGPDFGFRAISGPAPGPYFIRALSPTEQLESKNGGYFFIDLVGASRVDFENEILKRNFLFSGGVLGGFWRILVSARPLMACISDLVRKFHFVIKNTDSMRKMARKIYTVFLDSSCSHRATGHPWVGRIPKPAKNPSQK